MGMEEKGINVYYSLKLTLALGMCLFWRRIEMMTFLFDFSFVIMSFLHCRKFAGNHIVQTQLMNDLLVGIRVSMMLVQKLQDFQGIHLKISSSPIWQSMCGLLSIFTKFVSDGKCKTIQMTIIIECQSPFADNSMKYLILS